MDTDKKLQNLTLKKAKKHFKLTGGIQHEIKEYVKQSVKHPEA